MNAVFLPVFAQHLWSAVIVAGLTAVGASVTATLLKRQTRLKRATIRVKTHRTDSNSRSRR